MTGEEFVFGLSSLALLITLGITYVLAAMLIVVGLMEGGRKLHQRLHNYFVEHHKDAQPRRI